MYYSYYKTPSLSKNIQSVFAGLNKNARISENECSDMQNMTSDAYPLLSPRKGRSEGQAQSGETVTNEDGEEATEYKKLNGILGEVGFASVWGNDFYYMGKKVEGISLSDGEKNLLAFNGYILSR